MEVKVYSIGHGNKSWERLLEELNSFSIEYLIDVRSKPYSKWNPHFNREELEKACRHAGLTYVFMGDQLGGLPADRSCYNLDNKVLYDRVREKAFFQSGIDRLETAVKKKICVAMMCSEGNPAQCHRSKLVGEKLQSLSIPVAHILEPGKVKSQVDVMNEVNGGKNSTDLFGDQISLNSRKSYE